MTIAGKQCLSGTCCDTVGSSWGAEGGAGCCSPSLGGSCPGELRLASAQSSSQGQSDTGTSSPGNVPRPMVGQKAFGGLSDSWGHFWVCPLEPGVGLDNPHGSFQLRILYVSIR